MIQNIDIKKGFMEIDVTFHINQLCVLEYSNRPAISETIDMAQKYIHNVNMNKGINECLKFANDIAKSCINPDLAHNLVSHVKLQ